MFPKIIIYAVIGLEQDSTYSSSERFGELEH